MNKSLLFKVSGVTLIVIISFYFLSNSNLVLSENKIKNEKLMAVSLMRVHDSPRWSPDGKYILYERTEPSEDKISSYWLYNIKKDVANKINIRERFGKRIVTDVIWVSSKEIAIVNLAERDYRISIMDIETKEILSTIELPFSSVGISYSRGKFALVPVPKKEGERKENIITIMNKDGSESYDIEAENVWAYFGGRLSWSPDGKKIAYIKLDNPDAPKEEWSYNLCIIDADGKFQKQLTHFENKIVSFPKWHPAGDRIAFAVSGIKEDPKYPKSFLYIVDVGDGTIEKITGEISLSPEMDFSPDGRKIVYPDKEGSLWIGDLRGEN
jgi:Tol biopolymer transport system component